MKTTIDIPNNLLEEVITMTGSDTKKEAVLTAMKEFVRHKKLSKLADLLGTFNEFITLNELRRIRKKTNPSKNSP